MTDDELKGIESRVEATRGNFSIKVGRDDAQLVIDALNDRRLLLAEVRRLRSERRYSTEAVDALLGAWGHFCCNDPEVDEFTVGAFMNAVRSSLEQKL